MAEKKKKETPLFAQWNEIKAQYPDTLLLYRVGDFYETFGEDAVTVSKTLGIVLTRRSSGAGTYTPLAGIPYHAIDNYLPKLVQAGFKVAVCDQLEDPKLTKKLVKRGVTELVTPGVAYNDNLLKQKENNFLAAVAFDESSGGAQRGAAGVAFLDISTGTFRVAQGSLDYIEVLLSDLNPKEILVERSFLEGFRRRFHTKAYLTAMDEWAFVPESCRRKLLERFGTENLKGFGIEDMPLGITAAGAELFYMEMTCHSELNHLRTLSRIDEHDFVWMDRFTVRNLELFHSIAGDEGTSLLQVIDRCSSPMGARLLRQWLAMPLKDPQKINERYDVVSAFLSDGGLLDSIRDRIGDIGDMERIISKAAAGRIAPRETLQLARGLEAISAIRQQLEGTPLEKEVSRMDACDDLFRLIRRSILPEAAPQIGKGEVIAPGVSQELDELRSICNGGKEILLRIQESEKERTGIASLRIGYNNVFGYYLEVRNTFKDRVPAEWIRKQTLVGAERYITEELKQYEEKIVGAEERILRLEAELYAEVVRHIQELIPMLQEDAAIVARLDVLSSFAEVARTQDYCRPEVNESLEIRITQGRHPVIETLMGPGEEYIANDLYLNNADEQIIILTGPNMAGKSAFLRQSALIVLLAQIGCFVPAKAAQIGVVDKIFTRVGASDNISRGESTFMVEMLETATILNNLSPRSLILLDEIGRGTSTFDGMSIAWGIVEYLHGDNRPSSDRPKTLFATHYHELGELEDLYDRVHNYHISVKEIDGKILFLRKLCKGGVSHSFGIHVARLAGMPQPVILSAERKLRELENAAGEQPAKGGAGSTDGSVRRPVQLSLYQLDDPLLLEIKQQLKEADINRMSPLDAFDFIRELKKKIGL